MEKDELILSSLNKIAGILDRLNDRLTDLELKTQEWHSSQQEDINSLYNELTDLETMIGQ